MSGLVAMALSGLAVADVVILNPGELKGQVSLGPVSIQEFHLRATSSGGLTASKTFTASPYSLTVESGHAYQGHLRASFVSPSGGQSFLEVARKNFVSVDNQVGPTTMNFNYPNTRLIPFSLGVVGGTLARYDLFAAVSGSTEDHASGTYRSLTGTQPASASDSLAMIPSSQVSVTGRVSVTTLSGIEVQRELQARTFDMLQGTSSLSWTIDLSDTGHVAGTIAVPPGVTVLYHQLYVKGVQGTGTAGIDAVRQVSAGASYDLELPPGPYDIYLRTQFSAGPQYSDTKSYRVTVTTGATTPLNFTDPMGTARIPLLVGGFLSNADVTSAEVLLMREDPPPGLATQAHSDVLVNGRLDLLVPSGSWRQRVLSLYFHDVSNPAVEHTSVVSRHSLGNISPLVPVAGGSTVSFSPQPVTLVRTTLYFDVQEASPGAPETLLSYPSATLRRTSFDANSGGGWDVSTTASSSATDKSVVSVKLIAEPGTHSLNAVALVNGGYTQFPSQSLTIAEPTPTPAGTNVSITPVDKQDLKVDITFPGVSAGGITTVVESPLGPEVPQGLKSFCADGASAEGLECSPVFYDIATTAQFTEATVCVRRKFQGTNALSQFLRLYHFNKDALPSGQWEELPPPPGMVEPAFDCSADPATCGCDSVESCGFDYTVDPPVSVMLICGVTSSFSPFAVFEKGVTFTNKVGGVEYQGPTGPPSPRTWTAPKAGAYRITATGASGASSAAGLAGGCGARVGGVFNLQANDTLVLRVGQKGTATTYNAGGGGGSFVALNGNPLLVAGGGGGVRTGALVPGRHGNTGTAGTAGSTNTKYLSAFVAGGTAGQGGTRATTYGSGGGGWFGNGASDGTFGEGGFSFLAGSQGGAGKACGGLAHGGYGGGGAGNGCYGAGGGGGYSGGGGGLVGGGGGSWNTGSQPVAVGGSCTPHGHGEITIEFAHP
ncbi:glycine-rich protein [Myxococcus landrumensis]|uniref:Endo-1,C4-beta-glucanase n=1 Tax=Myxococcus landrumensis TaxID=2813577 RepID=A0ABX7N9T1_9BACT|nr:glycine-rich protein [Myxococcus landrumus]QSQ14176.1 endo-1,C4-beta-glucanase [Myxococcus landrumus]